MSVHKGPVLPPPELWGPDLACNSQCVDVYRGFTVSINRCVCDCVACVYRFYICVLYVWKVYHKYNQLSHDNERLRHPYVVRYVADSKAPTQVLLAIVLTIETFSTSDCTKLMASFFWAPHTARQTSSWVRLQRVQVRSHPEAFKKKCDSKLLDHLWSTWGYSLSHLWMIYEAQDRSEAHGFQLLLMWTILDHFT